MKGMIFGRAAVVVGTAAVMMMLIAALPAFAQSATPCSRDIKQHCGDVTPGGGRLIRCYEEKKDTMSAGCRAWAERAKYNAAALKEECLQMIDSRCNNEKGDPLAMLECLQSNYVDLSYECREKLNTFKGIYPKPVNR